MDLAREFDRLADTVDSAQQERSAPAASTAPDRSVRWTLEYLFLPRIVRRIDVVDTGWSDRLDLDDRAVIRGPAVMRVFRQI